MSVPTSRLGGDAPSTDEGLRERKKRATRRALRMAGLELVAARGLDAVTVDEIAATAGVSPRTFFNYFTGKEDALVGNDPDLVARLLRDLDERPDGEPVLDSLRMVFVSYAATATVDRELWRLRLQVIEQNPSLLAGLLGATADLERRLTSALAGRLGVDPTTDPYPGLAANLAIAAARTALHHAGTGRPDRPLAEAMATVFDTLGSGLARPPVRA